jgi:hypothetical protein
MKANPIVGKTIRWTYSDGPMPNKAFEHTFEEDGAVSYSVVGGKPGTKPTREKKYEVAAVGHDVYAVSYLASSGYTLTSVLDFESGNVVSFASNEKELVVQHGTFEVVRGSRTERATRAKRGNAEPSRPQHSRSH